MAVEYEAALLPLEGALLRHRSPPYEGRHIWYTHFRGHRTIHTFVSHVHKHKLRGFFKRKVMPFLKQ